MVSLCARFFFFRRHILFGQKFRCETSNTCLCETHTNSHKHNFLAAPVFRFKYFSMILHHQFLHWQASEGHPMTWPFPYEHRLQIKSMINWHEASWSNERHFRYEFSIFYTIDCDDDAFDHVLISDLDCN